MAEDIFSYVTSEYQNGVDKDKVGARQKTKPVNTDKLKKEQAKAKQAEQAKARKEQYDKAVQARKAKKEAKKKREEKETKKLSKKEQFELREKAKKEGRELSSKEVIEKYQEDTKKEKEERKARKEKTTKKDLDEVRNAEALENKESKPGGLFSFLKHKKAAKDASLWLAKTYITTEDFISAQAILTGINEDPAFPKRLDKAFYLTNADMQLRLNNIPKAVEYVQLAIDATKKRREKGRLYYVMGQLYAENGQIALAEESFGKVGKFKPTYNTIYHAQMNVIESKLATGEYDSKDLVKELRRMSNDEKNEEFMDEVLYNLGNAYFENDDIEKAEEAYLEALDIPGGNEDVKVNANLALADFYYANKDYKKAGPRYQEASSGMSPEDDRVAESKLKAEALEIINSGYSEINKQDSLLALAKLPSEELAKIINKRATEEIREARRQKLEALGNSGSAAFTNPELDQPKRKRNRNDDGEQTFYFYDLNQSASGFSEFKQKWGDRPSRDGWRRYDYVKRFIRGGNQNNNNTVSNGTLDRSELFEKYMSEIPLAEVDKIESYEIIQENYYKVGQAFIEKIGDQENGISALETLLEKYPSTEFRPDALNLLSKANAYIGNTESAKDYQVRAERAGSTNPNGPKKTSENVSIDEFYERVYNAYEAKEYKKVVLLNKRLAGYSVNPFEDKFAFINAVSIGKIEGAEEMKTQLRAFIKEYGSSPLAPKAQELLKQVN